MARRGRLILAELLAFLLALGVLAVSATACEGGGGGGGELTTLTTKLSGEGKEGESITILEGSKVKDKATLSGKNASKATGKATYKVYSDKACKTLVTAAGEVTVSGESVPASSEEELAGGKAYYWQAHYLGDSKNAESTSPCTELATVKAKTSLSTKLAGEGKEGAELTVTEGVAVSDTATLSGPGTSMATGTVKYSVYSDWECKHLVAEAGEAKVSGEFVPASSKETLAAGSYYWQAVYSGDSLNSGSSSACGAEVLFVNPAVTTSLTAEGLSGEALEVLEGAEVKDAATLHGEHASTATGTVKYNIYSDKECKTLVKEAGEVTVNGANVPASPEEKLTPGTYYWQASYSGDANNPAAKSTCGTEIMVVTTASSLTTSLSGEGKGGEHIEVKEGAAVSDTATLSGTNASTAKGYVEYNIYSDSECKTLVSEAGEVSVSGVSVPASSKLTLPPGTYYWQAVYSGDGVNHSATSTCGAEIAVVTAPVTTSLSGEERTGSEIEVKEGAAVKDTATLHGEHAGTATGTVKYNIYSDKECKTLVKEAGEVTVNGANVPASTEEKPTPGTYYWQASYSGDANNPAAKSTCGTEISIIQPANAQYAGVGDSFSSGEGTLGYYARTNQTGQNENLCHRSPTAYPARVAEALFPNRRPQIVEETEVLKQQPTFIFRACSGALMENFTVLGKYNEWIEGNPAKWVTTPEQMLWLKLPGGEPATGPNNTITLVTLTLGGNDAGFATVAKYCVAGQGGYSAAICKEVINEWETGTFGNQQTLEKGRGIPSIELKLPNVLSEIHAAAPNARIRVPLYPQILNLARTPRITVGLLGFLWIDNPLPRTDSVAVALARFTKTLNHTITETVRTWAATEGVNARVMPRTAGAFTGHQLGSTGQRWVNEINPVMGQDRLEPAPESLHPNCLGHLALARLIVQDLAVPPIANWAC
jgi:GDSL-like Lipase/Acylhydrolase family